MKWRCSFVLPVIIISILLTAGCGGTQEAKTVSLPEGYSVTQIKQSKDGIYSVTLNDAIMFRKLEIKDKGKGKRLFFPKSETSTGDIFSIVTFKDRRIPVGMRVSIINNETGTGETDTELVVTNVKIKLLNRGKVKAFADVTFNNSITIKDYKVIETKDGYFVPWPSVRKTKGGYEDLVRPASESLKTGVENKVIEAYEKEKEKV